MRSEPRNATQSTASAVSTHAATCAKQEVLTAVSMQTCRSLPNVLEWPAVTTFRILRNVGNIYQTTRPTILPGAALTDLTAVCSNRIPNHGNSTASASTMPTVTLRADASQPYASEIPQGTAPRTDSRPPKYHQSGNTDEKTYPKAATNEKRVRSYG
jgi:hypothetical protein